MGVTIEVPQTEITVTAGGESIKVGCCISTGEGGESNTGLNVGAGDAGVFRDKSGWVLAFRTLVGGTNITITENADTIDIDATAAANDGELLFPVSGVYTGDSNLTWNTGTGTLAIGSQLTINANNVNNVNSIRFDTTPTDGPEIGKLVWDETEGTLCLGMPGNNVNLQIGQEFLTLCRNNTGDTIADGTAVYITGAIGNRPTIAKADSASLVTATVLGLTTEDIPNNSDGYVTSAGKVNNLNTSSYSSGDVLWLGSSGGYATTRPDAPAFSVAIGEVIQSHVSSGSIGMRPTLVPRLRYLSDVNIRDTAIANENLIWWDGANSRWDQVTTATLSASLDHNVMLNLDVGDVHTQYTLRSDWLQNGFFDRSESTLVWTDASPDRTLSIQPTGASFTYYEDGVPYVSTGDTVQITDVEGLHYIYYDGATLTEAVNPTIAQVDTVIRTKSIVAVVWWDTSAATAIYVGEERHGASMAPDTHAYLHFTEGLRWLGGLGLNTINADGSGVTADAQFGVDAGSVTDEDIYKAISSIGSTTGLPIYYMTGAATWNKYVNPGFSVRTLDGTDATRLAWNQYTGGAWQLTEVTNGRYVLCHVFATTEKDNPMLAIMGQAEYLNKPAAQAGAKTEVQSLLLNDFLAPEIKPVATVIFQTNNGYASAVNARIVSTEEGDDYVDWRSETVARGVVSTSFHGDLTGLGNDDHVQYILVDGTRAFTGTVDLDGNRLTIDADGDSYWVHSVDDVASLYLNGAEAYKFQASALTIADAGRLQWATRSRIQSNADGYISLTDTNGTSFSGLRLGPVSSSFPMLVRNGTNLELKKADNSGRTGLIALNIALTSSQYYSWLNQSSLGSPADGKIVLYNNAFNNFDMLQFGGTSSTEPAWQRSTTNLRARLADNTGWAGLQCGDFTSNGAFAHTGTTLGAFSATPITKPTVSGSKGGNAALASLMTALVNLGFVTDSTT